MSSVPASIPAGADLLRSALDILAEIESQTPDATGVLEFGQEGAVLVEGRAICWAAYESMPQRLTELLRHQRNPPIDRKFLQQLVLECKEQRKPVGEALLASGHISERGLRMALFRQTAEAIAHMARVGLRSTKFVPHTNSGYDPRFRYTPVEILAALGARNEVALAALASTRLNELRLESNGPFGVQVSGFACVADQSSCNPLLFASTRHSKLNVYRAIDLARWCLKTFETAKGISDTTQIVCGKTATESLLCWREGAIHYGALCSSLSAAALLMHALLQRNEETN